MGVTTKLTTAFAAVASLSLTTTLFPGFVAAQTAPEPIDNSVVFTPPDDYTDPRTLYARSVQLPGSGDLLLTWENYSPEPPAVYFPIYRSSDQGRTWTEQARVEDQGGSGFGLRYQPVLYVLPEAIEDFPAGTVLLAGSSIPTDLSSTQLDLYAATDGEGIEWEFVSHVAAGGRAVPDNGLTPVWEPFLLAPEGEGKLLFYYADQRDNATHGQKLSHQVSTNLLEWSDPVDDAAYETYEDRPGMPTVALLPNGQYMYVYEYGGGENPGGDGSYQFPVYYRLSEDPESFGSADHQVINAGGSVPNGSPYVVWTPAGGDDGTIVVSSGCCSELWINKALGAADAWEVIATPEPRSYTRSLLVFEEDPSFILIAGAGVLPPSTTNQVTVSVIQI